MKLTAEEWERKMDGIRATNKAMLALQEGWPGLLDDNDQFRENNQDREDAFDHEVEQHNVGE